VKYFATDAENPIQLGLLETFIHLDGSSHAFIGGENTRLVYVAIFAAIGTCRSAIEADNTDTTRTGGNLQFTADNDTFMVLTSCCNDDNARSNALNLYAQAKATEIKAEHVKSYFASLGMPSVGYKKIAEFLKDSAFFVPDIRTIPLFRNVRHDNKVMGYRLGRFSWPTLYQKCKGDIGPFMDDHSAYDNASCENQADADLMSPPDMLIMHAYLKATDGLPDDWWQGNRIKDESSPAQYKFYLKLFKKYLDLKFAASEIDSITDFENFKLFMGTKLKKDI
jgi:hypothetical protein